MTNQNIIQIEAGVRTKLGSKDSKHLRKENKIPAVIYGAEGAELLEPIHICVAEKLFNLMFANKNLISKIFEIKLSNGKTQKAIIKDFQINHVAQKILHLDFIRISEDGFVKAKIPINYINKQKSIAIKKGGFLNVARYFVEIRCKGENIPSSFTIDLEGTDVLDRFYVENLDLPKDSKIVFPKQLLCNFVSKRGKAIKA